jgi:hypothetical protein
MDVIPVGDTGRAEQWARQIRVQLAHSVESIIAAGELLSKAKEDLPRAEWARMFSQQLLPFEAGTAERLIAIASHPTLSNRANVRYLPPSFGTLFALTRVPEQVLLDGFKAGAITPAMERHEVRTLVPLERISDEPRSHPAVLTPVIPANGMKFARMAVSDLEQIEHNDSERAEALTYVRDWLDYQKPYD